MEWRDEASKRGTAVRAQFKFRREDYKQLLLSWPRPIWRGLIQVLMPIVGYPLLVFGSLGIYLTGLHASSAWTYVEIFGLVFVLAHPLFLRFELSRDYKSQEFEICIQESGVEIKSHEKTTQYSWSDFSHFRGTRKHFILFFPNGALVVPIRVFSDEALNAVRTFLWRNLPENSPFRRD